MRKEGEVYRTCLYCIRQCCVFQICSAGISRNNPLTHRCQRAIHRTEQSRARALYLKPPIPRVLKSLPGCAVHVRCPKDYKITHCSLSSKCLFPSSDKWPYLDAEKYNTSNHECDIWLENSVGRSRHNLVKKKYILFQSFLEALEKTTNVRSPYRSRILDLPNMHQEISPVSPDFSTCI